MTEGSNESASANLHSSITQIAVSLIDYFHHCVTGAFVPSSKSSLNTSFMFRILLFLTALFVSVSTTTAQPTTQLLDSLVNAYARQGKFHGSVLVAQKGNILLEKGYGWKDVTQKTKADANSIYQYGSVTKQFTTALIMHLQEKGKLNTQDKVSKYFPQLPFADSITIYNLMTHTSGIFNYTNNPDFMKSEAVKPANQEKIFALFQNKPLEFPPGSKFNYSNSNYMLLGYIIEKASGMPYETLARQVILQPFGMKTAGFDFANLKSPDRATGYHFINGDKYEAAGIVDSSVAYAAGSLFGSAKDLYAWHTALQQGKLLSAQSWKQVYTPFHNKYAFGWNVDSMYGKQVMQHGGGIFGFTSMFKRFPQDDVVVIVLSNNSSSVTGEIANNLAALVYGKEAKWPKQRAIVQLRADQLEKLTGDYELMPNFIITVSLEKEQLMVQATGQPKTNLVAESENSFYLTVVEADISFDKDASGTVTGLKLTQGGRTMPAKKIK
jgi:CubicO group peptidase (beta-lactamase class C family)